MVGMKELKNMLYNPAMFLKGLSEDQGVIHEYNNPFIMSSLKMSFIIV